MATMLLPVWVADWEFECCHPDAVVGEEWEACLTLQRGRDPWWVEQYGGSLTAEGRQLGGACSRLVLDAGVLDIEIDEEASVV